MNLLAPPGMPREAFLARTHEINDTVNAVAKAIGGSFSAEHGIGQLKAGLLPGWKGEVEFDLMRKVKRALDPEGRLNPGKVFADRLVRAASGSAVPRPRAGVEGGAMSGEERPKLSDVLYNDILVPDQARRLSRPAAAALRAGTEPAVQRLAADRARGARAAALGGRHPFAPRIGQFRHRGGRATGPRIDPEASPPPLQSIDDLQKFYDFRLAIEGEAAFRAALDASRRVPRAGQGGARRPRGGGAHRAGRGQPGLRLPHGDRDGEREPLLRLEPARACGRTSTS